MIELHHCDFLDAPVPKERAALVLCDLPYGQLACEWDVPVDLRAAWRWIANASTQASAVLSFATGRFEKDVFNAWTGFAPGPRGPHAAQWRHDWVWEKSRATGHLNVSRAPMRAHETISAFSRAQIATFNPQKTHGHKMKKVERGGQRSDSYGSQKDRLGYESTSRFPRSVLRFDSAKRSTGTHPTAKPVALLRYLIRTYTNPGDLVVDPTMGSGSTGVAAVEEGRRFFGVELDREWFDYARDRIKAAAAQGDLFREVRA